MKDPLRKRSLTELDDVIEEMIERNPEEFQELMELVDDKLKNEIKVNQTAEKTTIKFLEINIDELKRILQDVEQCIGVEK